MATSNHLGQLQLTKIFWTGDVVLAKPAAHDRGGRGVEATLSLQWEHPAPSADHTPMFVLVLLAFCPVVVELRLPRMAFGRKLVGSQFRLCPRSREDL